MWEQAVLPVGERSVVAAPEGVAPGTGEPWHTGAAVAYRAACFGAWGRRAPMPTGRSRWHESCVEGRPTVRRGGRTMCRRHLVGAYEKYNRCNGPATCRLPWCPTTRRWCRVGARAYGGRQTPSRRLAWWRAWLWWGGPGTLGSDVVLVRVTVNRQGKCGWAVQSVVPAGKRMWPPGPGRAGSVVHSWPAHCGKGAWPVWQGRWLVAVLSRSGLVMHRERPWRKVHTVSATGVV